MDDLYFEDFFVGQVIESEEVTITQDEIVSFGERYAPLPYHTDPEAAAGTMFGEIVAPGYQTAALTFGLFVRTGTFRACGMGRPASTSCAGSSRSAPATPSWSWPRSSRFPRPGPPAGAMRSGSLTRPATRTARPS